MSPSRVLVLLVIIAVFAVLGTVAGIYVQALRLVEKPQEFRSLGALVVGAALSAPQGSSQAMDDLYGTIIETLGSQEMHRDATERIKALYPELEHSRVQIRASWVKGSGIIKVLATGSEPRYTRVFLDALLDEVIAHRQYILSSRRRTKATTWPSRNVPVSPPSMWRTGSCRCSQAVWLAALAELCSASFSAC